MNELKGYVCVCKFEVKGMYVRLQREEVIRLLGREIELLALIETNVR